MSNKVLAVVAVISLLVSVSGWIVFVREKTRQWEMREKLAEYVLQQVEDRRKMEESIKEQLRQKKQEKEVVMQLEYERQLQDSINNQLKQYEKDRQDLTERQFDDLRSWTAGLVKQEIYAFSGSLRRSVMDKLREYEQQAEENATGQSVILEKKFAAYKEETAAALRGSIDKLKEEIQQEFCRQRAEIRAALLKQQEELESVMRGAAAQPQVQGDNSGKE